jgi:16S rRNA (uracil1498-N3)-methyltransferase
MLQSQQHYLPQLNEATKFTQILKTHENTEQKLIAHCEVDFERMPIASLIAPQQNTVILIGPEGDFSPDEINLAMQSHFKGTILCNQRLRTETAAMAVCAYFNLLNNE